MDVRTYVVYGTSRILRIVQTRTNMPHLELDRTFVKIEQYLYPTLTRMAW